MMLTPAEREVLAMMADSFPLLFDGQSGAWLSSGESPANNIVVDPTIPISLYNQGFIEIAQRGDPALYRLIKAAPVAVDQAQMFRG
jgi:hypothetical protein